MAGSDKVVINLATGMEDGERVLVAFLVATAAQQQGKEVVVWATKEAVRLGLPGGLQGVVCKDCPPLEGLWEQFTEAGGELWLCPICLASRDLGEAETVANTKVAGATPTHLMWTDGPAGTGPACPSPSPAGSCSCGSTSTAACAASSACRRSRS